MERNHAQQTLLIIQQLDEYLNELQSLRQAIAADDQEKLFAVFSKAKADRENSIIRRKQNGTDFDRIYGKRQNYRVGCWVMLNTPVTDLDVETVRRAGMLIADIFAQNGEPYFRQLEHDTLAEILKSDQGILAPGGGTPMRSDNLAMLKDTPTPVVLLKASATETLGANLR